MDYSIYGEVKKDVSLKNYNTYKVEATARLLITVSKKELLISLINKLQELNEPFFLLGNGSNIILADDYYHKIFIKVNIKDFQVLGEDKIYCDSGLLIQSLIQSLFNNNLGGLEWASGIPGSIGGLIYNNAGAYNEEMSTYIDKVFIYDMGQKKESILDNKDCKFSYRDSLFKNNKNILIIGAIIKVKKVDVIESKALIKDRLKRRLLSQPLDYPSAGSVFRNPVGDYAGRLIEDSNLKNTNINDAYISDKHANFIINKKKAKGCDIVALIDIIKSTILQNYQIALKLEQEIIKD